MTRPAGGRATGRDRASNRLGTAGTLLLLLVAVAAASVGLIAQDAPPPPDLEVLPFEGLPASVESGESLPLDVAVRCHEPDQLSENPRLRVTLRRQDKPEACAAAVEILAREVFDDGLHVETVDLNTEGLAGGTYEIVAEVDFDNRIAERSESNNRVSAYFRIEDPRIELHPTGIEIDPASPIEWGESAALRATIENSGGLAAGGLHVRYALLPVLAVGPMGQVAELATMGSSDAGCDSADWAVLEGVAGESARTLEMEALDRGLARAESLCDAAWVNVASVFVPGLPRDGRDEVTAILVTAQITERLDDLRQAMAVALGLSPSGIQLDDWRLTLLLRVSIESAIDVDELDATNNELLAAVQIVPSGLDDPDLSPVSIAFDEDLPLNWDDSMTVTATIKNRGGGLAEDIEVFFDYRPLGYSEWRPVRVRSTASGTVEVPEIIDLLGVEEGSNTDSINTEDVYVMIDPRSATTPLSPGTYELRVTVDKREQIEERNESNNQLITAFSVRGSELRPLSLDVPPETIHQGDTITVSCLVENTGDRPVSSFSVSFYIDDTRFDTFYYASTGQGLDEDERARCQGILGTEDLPHGSYRLRVVVDPDDDIPEFDEGNNTIAFPLTIEPPRTRRAELHPLSLQIDPASPVPTGRVLTIAAEVANTGSIQAQGFDVRIRLRCETCAEGGIVYEQTLPVDRLDRGARTSRSAAFDTSNWPQGSYSVSVTTDPSSMGSSGTRGAVEEEDETNNTLTAGLRLGAPEPAGPGDVPTDTPGVNLSCVMSVPAREVGAQEAILRIDGRVANTGTEPSGPFSIRFLVRTASGVVVRDGVLSVNSLGSGRSTPYLWTVDIAGLGAGNYVVLAIVDPENRIVEGAESDNQCQMALRISTGTSGLSDCRADLVPTAVRVRTSTGAGAPEVDVVDRGQPLYGYVTVQNLGCVASGPFRLSVTSNGSPLLMQDVSSIDALDASDVSFILPTDEAGTYQLGIEVDVAGQVEEGAPGSEAEANNRLPNAYVGSLPTYSVLAIEPIAPTLVTHPPSGSPIRWIEGDDARDLVFALSLGGGVFRVSGEEANTITILDGGTVRDVVFSLGAQPAAYVAMGDDGEGLVARIDLDDGDVVAEAGFQTVPITLALGIGGRIYVGVADGFHELVPSAGDFAVSRRVDVPGDVLQIAYAEDRGTIYVLSTEGIYAYDTTLSPVCALDVAELVGSPTVMAVAGTGLYVATVSGSGSILYAASHCVPSGSSSGGILVGWRYPRTGGLTGVIESIVIDPRDIDPIYLTTDAGELLSLDINGRSMWTYETQARIQSTPVADRRTGRLFFGDDAGRPHVLTLQGAPAFEIQSLGSENRSIRSSLAIIETREATDHGSRLVRNYYYGTEGGEIYRIASSH